MPRRFARLLTPLALIAAFVAIGVVPTAALGSSTTATANGNHRLGGPVRSAWPEKAKHRPKTAISRWLARQVGPTTPIPCAKRAAKAGADCAATKGSASASSSTSIGMRSAVAESADGARTERISLRALNSRRQLQLIRSFDIPADDPSYERLLNWSWTYDSAVAATAFSSVELPEQAGRLLDQLAALQHKEGSIELAFDVRTGEASTEIRAGSIAFAAIAFTDYDAAFGGTHYLDNARRAADYLLSLRNEEGLVQGGPEVKWVSTQHNILTLIALTGLVQELQGQGDEEAAAYYREAAEMLIKGIDKNLIVRDGGLSHFRQGLNDEVVPLDTQTLGVVYALFIRDETLAKEVFEFAQQNFAIDHRSIKLSKKKATYNMSYEAKGPFTGYRPYLGKGSPDVLWFEGTAQMRFVSQILKQPTEALDQSMNSWWDVTREQGLAPLAADRTITTSTYNEYHVWPAAAAGAWTVLSGAAKDTAWADPSGALLELKR